VNAHLNTLPFIPSPQERGCNYPDKMRKNPFFLSGIF
jgi:hypothetical protein